jgi:hypothetical protein
VLNWATIKLENPWIGWTTWRRRFILGGGCRRGRSYLKPTPPFFMVITYDDKDRSIGLAEGFIALKEAKVSAELHIYSEGGHGYGLRRTDKPVTSWPDRMEDWLNYHGFLAP